MSDVDRLVELITQKVKERLHGQPAQVKLNVLPRDRGECNDDTAPGEDCAECGSCVVRRPWSVRAMEGAGALRVGAPPGVGQVPADLAKLIDHTLLKPEATRDEVVKLCEEAKKHRFASVCVNTTWVPLCKALLSGTDVMVCAVVGFPLGAMAPTAKAYEAREAVRQGAKEIDMVINIGALRRRDTGVVFNEIRRVVEAAGRHPVKVIIETAYLTQAEKRLACRLAARAGAAYVKTSTGFGPKGATAADVALMRRIVPPSVGVKAAGGIRTYIDALALIRAGADLLGTSQTDAILTEAASVAA